MITFENIQQLEKYTLMTMHGLFNQLKLGIISIENAEHTLFTPYMLETLSSLGVKDSIVDLIHKGTELEDFAAFNLSIEDTVTVCLQRTLPAVLRRHGESGATGTVAASAAVDLDVRHQTLAVRPETACGFGGAYRVFSRLAECGSTTGQRSWPGAEGVQYGCAFKAFKG